MDLRERQEQEAGENCNVLFTKYYYSNEIKEDEMGKTCNMHGRDEKHTT